jgi:hypothetical protein
MRALLYSIPMFRGQGWGDTRIQMNDYVKSARLAEISKPRYLVGGPSLDRLLGQNGAGGHNQN